MTTIADLEQTLIYQDPSSWTIATILLRLIIAFIVGGVIGLDRGIKRRGAGIKTHTILCTSSALVMLTGQYLYTNFSYGTDIARLGAQVISGVGFLGMATIIVTGHHQVRGLTTAATSWACACLGLSIGCGFIFPSVIVCILLLVALHVMPAIDRYIYSRSKFFQLYVEFKSFTDFTSFSGKITEKGILITRVDKLRPKADTETLAFFMSFEVSDKAQRDTFVSDVNSMEEVVYVIES